MNRAPNYEQARAIARLQSAALIIFLLWAGWVAAEVYCTPPLLLKGLAH